MPRLTREERALVAVYGTDWMASEDFASDMLGMGLGNPGICLHCHEPREGCEPDARNYPCDACGRNEVFGVAEIGIGAL